MLNRSTTKQPMPVQDPAIRITNFQEVALGYTREQAIDEARRCLDCKHKPCVAGCPVEIDIPVFINHIIDGDMKRAFETIFEASSLPAVCGRVCPQETQCELVCVRANKGEPVAIGRLERFAADEYFKDDQPPLEKPVSNGRKTAVVGSGPAGITCARELALAGFDVTMFEALHMTGGVLVYGIPEFRLPKNIVDQEVGLLEKLGVKIRTNVIIGRTLTVDDLFEDGYEAVFLGTGAGLPRFMDIEGETLNGVYSANEFLTRINLMKAHDRKSATPVQMAKRVAVVGGGNVAMDAARAAKRLGAETVYIVYRRSMEEIPARAEEVHHAQDEGIILKLLTNPVKILGDEDGEVKGIRCVEMTLGEPDDSGRRRPVTKPDSAFDIDVDAVIMAIGTSPNPMISQTTPGLETDRWGCIVTKGDDGLTTRERVFAGGDAVTGAATVILAMGAGKKAAKAMIDMLTQGRS